MLPGREASSQPPTAATLGYKDQSVIAENLMRIQEGLLPNVRALLEFLVQIGLSDVTLMEMIADQYRNTEIEVEEQSKMEKNDRDSLEEESKLEERKEEVKEEEEEKKNS